MKLMRKQQKPKETIRKVGVPLLDEVPELPPGIPALQNIGAAMKILTRCFLQLLGRQDRRHGGTGLDLWPVEGLAGMAWPKPETASWGRARSGLEERKEVQEDR